jgi:cyclin B
MLVASKYEEIYSPEIGDFIYMCDKAYTRKQILTQERRILRALNFNLTAPSIHRFLERFTKIDQSDSIISRFSSYLGELTLCDLKMYSYNPSLIAAAAIYTAKKVLKRPQTWNAKLE